VTSILHDGVIYKSFIRQKTGSTQKHTHKTNLNKLNRRATCSQISQHSGRAEQDKLNCDNLKLHAFDVLNSFMKNMLMTKSSDIN